MTHNLLWNQMYYKNLINNYTKPQSTDRYIYDKLYTTIYSNNKLLDNNKQILEYQQRKHKQAKIKQNWIIAQDEKGKYYKYNTITKYSKWL